MMAEVGQAGFCTCAGGYSTPFCKECGKRSEPKSPAPPEDEEPPGVYTYLHSHDEPLVHDELPELQVGNLRERVLQLQERIKQETFGKLTIQQELTRFHRLNEERAARLKMELERDIQYERHKWALERAQLMRDKIALQTQLRESSNVERVNELQQKLQHEKERRKADAVAAQKNTEWMVKKAKLEVEREYRSKEMQADIEKLRKMVADRKVQLSKQEQERTEENKQRDSYEELMKARVDLKDAQSQLVLKQKEHELERERLQERSYKAIDEANELRRLNKELQERVDELERTVVQLQQQNQSLQDLAKSARPDDNRATTLQAITRVVVPAMKVGKRTKAEKRDAAATLIQAIVRGFLARRRWKRTKRRTEIVREIVDSEAKYARSLGACLAVYLRPLRDLALTDKSIIPETRIQAIFSTLEIIHDSSLRLFRKLEARLAQWHYQQHMSDLFCEALEIGLFESYVPFTQNFGESLDHRQVCLDTIPAFTYFLKICACLPQSEGLTLNDFLIMPIQRIPRYVLLLEDLCAHTPKGHPDFTHTMEAVAGMRKFALRINEKRRELEQMLFIGSRLSGAPSVLITPGRKFIAEYPIACPKRKTTHMLVFSDLVVLAVAQKKKRRKDSKDEPHLRFTLMAPLTLRTTLTAAPDEEATIPNSFLIKTQNITAATIEEITLHLVAESVEEKGRAMATLSGAIESQRAARKLTPSKGRKLAELTRLRQPTNASAPTVGTELAVSNSVPALHASNHSSPMVAFSSSPVPSKRKEDAQFASPTAALISALHTRKTSSAKTGKIVKATSTSNLKEI